MPYDLVDEEIALVTRVTRLLAEVPFETPPSEKGLLIELVRLREEMTHAKSEDKASIMSQYDHQFALLNQLRSSRDKPQVDPDSPYFAHLRLREDGEERDLCLGKATRIDHGLRIVDWRNAPISRIFYSYQQGEEFEEEFGERTMEGIVVARRTVTIRHATLQRIDAPEGTYLLGDDSEWTMRERSQPRLAGGQGSSATKVHDVDDAGDRRLGTDGSGRTSRADKRLPDIAGLIDPDQFDLITRPSTGFLVIRGTAGSGKTTVALHRIAYLAYHDPKIDSAQTLFLVFSKALRDYVGKVLPALGIGKVRPRTFPSWAAEQRKRHFPKLPRAHRDDTPEVVIRLKSHPVTMIAIEQQADAVDGPSNAEQAIDDWASVLTQFETLAPIYRELAPSAFTDAQLRRAVEYNRDRHQELLAWRDREEDATALLDPEDDALLLRAWQVRVGPLTYRGRPLTYKHIAIDEVQDFSPVEVRVLIGTLDERKSITLAGDTQQHVMSNAGFTSWAEFFSWLGVKGTAVETLRVAYRSAEPIVTFATKLLGEFREDDVAPMTVRDGPPVEFFRFTDDGAAVAFLADALKALSRDEPLASIALVAPHPGVSNMYYDGLSRAEVPRLRLIRDEEFSFTPGVDIVEVQSVKGLEFDYVVILEASAMCYPDLPSRRRQLHVAATRAIHQLWVMSVRDPSPIVREVLGE
jgi:DNA helicase-2/ATP-dependent DNA helicase PcrA